MIAIGVYTGPYGIKPHYMTGGSAAFDLAVPENTIIPPYSYKEIQFELVFWLPPGHMLYIRPRNSLFKNYKLIFVGSGIVDKDYCGPEDKVNFPVYNPTREIISIVKGTRIAQGVLIKVEKVALVPYLPKGKSRGGTGSTGSK